MFYDYNLPPREDIAAISKNAADCAMIALGFVVLVTMYQITVSIQLLYEEISVQAATKRRIIFNTIAGFCVLFHISSTTAIYLVTTFGAVVVASLECGMTILLTTVFCFVLTHFLKKLSKFKIRSSLSNEKRSVRKQFYVFFWAFSTKAIYSGYWLITIFYISNVTISNYPTALVTTFMWIPWNILPISLVFYVHHKTYAKIMKSNRLSSESNSSGEETREITIGRNAFYIEEPYESVYLTTHQAQDNEAEGEMLATEAA